MEIETVVETRNKPIRFTNDIFFKYCLAGQDEASKTLRQGIIKELLHTDFKELRVINPEITAMVLQGKGIRLDILLQDTISKEIINIEMQISKYKSKEAKRFQFYGSRLVVNQIESGNEYKRLVRVYQIIFIDDVFDDGNLINYYQSKNQNSILEEDNLITRIYVHLPVINRVVKERGIENLSDFEKVCYLFKNNSNNDILKVTEGVEGMVKILMDKYNEFEKESKLWSWAQAIEDGEMYVRSRISEGYEEGLEKGIEDGKRQGLEQGLEKGLEQGLVKGRKDGKMETTIIAVDKRYHVHSSQWVTGLSDNQLENVLNMLFEIDDFDTLKKQIEAM